jgi:copper(I)-binding protein
MVVRNRGDQVDRLIRARSPACGMTELFEWQTSPQGVMTMRKVAGVDVPPGGNVQLKPAALHVMCMERKGTYRPGSTLPLTLSFERAGDIAVVVTVREP